MSTQNRSRAVMKRPSLFAVKELLEAIRKARMDDKFSMATFNYLAGPPISNRTDLGRYLNLLLRLQWITKKEQKDFAGKRTIFQITDKGIRFLRLFPRKNQGNAVTES